MAEWPDLDPEIVNPSAVRSRSAIRWDARARGMLATLAHQLHRTGGGWGLATMCIGVGQGIAVVIESG